MRTIQQFQSGVVRTAGAVPGVSAVSLTSELPFPGGKGSRSFALEAGWTDVADGDVAQIGSAQLSRNDGNPVARGTHAITL